MAVAQPAAITMPPPAIAACHGERAAASFERAPQQDRGREQIKHLHQRLRGEPGIAAEQQPFLAAERGARRGDAEAFGAARARGRRSAGAGSRDGIIAEARRDERYYGVIAATCSPMTKAGADDGGEHLRYEPRTL